jgi:hypothetical protein
MFKFTALHHIIVISVVIIAMRVTTGRREKSSVKMRHVARYEELVHNHPSAAFLREEEDAVRILHGMRGLGKRNVEFDSFVRKVTNFYKYIDDPRRSEGDSLLYMSAALNCGIALTMGISAGKRLDVYSSLIRELRSCMHISVGDYAGFPVPTDPWRDDNYDLM